jgi:hypothetical protein
MNDRVRRAPTAAELAVRHGTLLQRLMVRVVVQPSGCWHWQGAKRDAGYGVFKYQHKVKSAHRWVFEELVGPIPDGTEADHLCRNRICVNPDHIEWVTHDENIRRAEMASGAANWNGAKTHCPAGHPYEGENLRRWKGRRYCRACAVERLRQWHLARSREGAA